MKTLVSGHRIHKLECYDIGWIQAAIKHALEKTFLNQTSMGLSGMASGVDLWFCESCVQCNIKYVACIPFEGQKDTMNSIWAEQREACIKNAIEIWNIRNSLMVEKTDAGLIVFDGNKGGTHNVFQQMIEKKKPFVWLNPVNQNIYEID